MLITFHQVINAKCKVHEPRYTQYITIHNGKTKQAGTNEISNFSVISSLRENHGISYSSFLYKILYTRALLSSFRNKKKC